MKAQIKKKDAKELADYGFPYCEIQYLLMPYAPLLYTAGIYGRNEDLYHINGVWISTGYNYSGKRADYKLARKYDDKARQIYNDREKYDSRKEKERALKQLMNRFLKALQKQDGE